MVLDHLQKLICFLYFVIGSEIFLKCQCVTQSFQTCCPSTNQDQADKATAIPVLLSVLSGFLCFPALFTGYTFSRAVLRLHVPRFELASWLYFVFWLVYRVVCFRRVWPEHMFVYLLVRFVPLVRFLSYVASPIFNRNNYYRIVLTDQNSKVAPEIRKSDMRTSVWVLSYYFPNLLIQVAR